MGYVIRESWGARLVAVVLLAATAFVLAPIPFAYLMAALQQGSDSGSGLDAGRAMLIAGSSAGLCIASAALAWRCRYERDRQVCGIRLMGGTRALLYFRAAFSRTVPLTPAARSAIAAASMLSPAISFPYDGDPAIAVTVARVVHWPGCLLSLTFDPASPADVALDRLDGPRPAPRMRPLLGGWPPWSRRRPVTVPLHAPRHLMIFADAMPAAQFRSLAISLACLQRGVTFVEHR